MECGRLFWASYLTDNLLKQYYRILFFPPPRPLQLWYKLNTSSRFFGPFTTQDEGRTSKKSPFFYTHNDFVVVAKRRPNKTAKKDVNLPLTFSPEIYSWPWFRLPRNLFQKSASEHFRSEYVWICGCHLSNQKLDFVHFSVKNRPLHFQIIKCSIFVKKQGLYQKNQISDKNFLIINFHWVKVNFIFI